MPLVMQVQGDTYGPICMCDGCGERIEKATEGNCEWFIDTDGKPESALYFTHKGRCSDSFRQQHPGKHVLWQPLAAFIIYLSDNTKLDQEMAKHTASIISSI